MESHLINPAGACFYQAPKITLCLSLGVRCTADSGRSSNAVIDEILLLILFTCMDASQSQMTAWSVLPILVQVNVYSRIRSPRLISTNTTPNWRSSSSAFNSSMIRVLADLPDGWGTNASLICVTQTLSPDNGRLKVSALIFED